MADTTGTGLPQALAIAWGMQEAPQRGPARGLTHARIVAAAIEIADTEGLGAVTMQAVAKSLGFTTMSLYRYVSSKDDLVRLMQDAAVTSTETVELPDDWREALRTWAGLVRDAYRAHPWVLETPRGQLSVLMPASVRAADMGLAALAGLDLADGDKVAAILLISQHVSSMVELEQSLAAEGTPAITPQGGEALREVITADHFPHLAPIMAAGGYVVGEEQAAEAEGVDAEYEFGLDLLIAGLESLERRRHST
ncbi:TetR/AcrR family transcriptional regulator C-terminal domain-containing protein [Actinomadura sp. 7K507]|uniref:TetR/AcrR family transcriptional regulator n=1 Tax=Actinomadura sp. 7K507 TaxID=2530365 RepID=UPI0010540CC8|nr:TetR/AcrR family transcriptional regulator C-terminal domain-containing protein [Actinomadura sp. 7K507]TDC89833.1 TetR/AcrR family transcriptional regulator [Actinomadura sp. 7K507]